MALTITHYCPCNDRYSQKSSNSYPNDHPLNKIKDPNNNYPLSNLNFCFQCQGIRCQKCVEPEFVANYCPNCLTFFNNESSFCGRNCFVCPLCDSNVTISSAADGSDSGKSFIFKCSKSDCNYKYNSGALDKPKSLSSFIRAKIAATLYHSQFSKLQKTHISLKKKQQDSKRYRGTHNPKKPDFKKLLEAMKHSSLNEGANVENIIPLNEEEDFKDGKLIESLGDEDCIIQYRQFLKSHIQYSLTSVSSSKIIKNISSNAKTSYQELLPIPRKLRSRKRLKCKDCRGDLVEPYVEDTSNTRTMQPGRIFKFLKTSDAIDILPSIKIKEFPGNEESVLRPNNSAPFVLIFKNPNLSHKMKVMISTFDATHSDYGVKVSLPCHDFTLGSLGSVVNNVSDGKKNSNDDEDEDEDEDDDDDDEFEKLGSIADVKLSSKINEPANFIKTIPTIELNDNTKFSRVELMTRNSDTNVVWSKLQDSSKQEHQRSSSIKQSIGIFPNGSPSKNLLKISHLNSITSAHYLAAENLSKHSFSSSQESLNLAANSSGIDRSSYTNSDDPLDSGANWCCVPMNIIPSKYDQHDYDLSIPLFISVEVLENENENENKAFGYWVVIHLGRVSVESADMSMSMSMNMSVNMDDSILSLGEAD
ncbi:hypothetical protein DASC09_020130 [Saccharomycopsis crataegensis]|uniref:Dynactin subunit 4 n=1 Tax=Saccharomycopsis crataegensis TaxID=43959 RepID=A0AAV5QIU3_9ASCO|nr:hypothetical protein DASC09_020130 [Saccharomycopsis crataegensis]